MTEGNKHDITISRVFDAPRELVYRAFVDSDQLGQWFGPEGFSVPFETVQTDARAGGFQRFVMVSDEDPSHRIEVDETFSEVVENELLDGHQDVEGMAGPGTKARFRLRLEFREEANGKTRLELRQGPFTPDAGHDVRTGWESSFITLDSLLRRSL